MKLKTATALEAYGDGENITVYEEYNYGYGDTTTGLVVENFNCIFQALALMLMYKDEDENLDEIVNTLKDLAKCRTDSLGKYKIIVY